MKQLDKMLKQARKSHDKHKKEVFSYKDTKITWDIHILEDNYCYSCHGECKHKDNYDDCLEAGRYKALFIDGEFLIEDMEEDYTPWYAYKALIEEAERQMKEDEAAR